MEFDSEEKQIFNLQWYLRLTLSCLTLKIADLQTVPVNVQVSGKHAQPFCKSGGI